MKKPLEEWLTAYGFETEGLARVSICRGLLRDYRTTPQSLLTTQTVRIGTAGISIPPMRRAAWAAYDWLMRIIVEYDSPAGRWNAWCDGKPDARYTGGSAVTALRRILQSNVTGGADWTSLEVDPTSSTRRRHVYTIRTTATGPCPDCSGQGQYIGLNVIEPCRACGGTGRISP